MASAAEAQTPVMRQYAEAKRQHPDALLLFRLGDFYELFYDDAVQAAQALQITLTARGKDRDKGEPIPMCGVPYHAAEAYIARLIALGFKVALCDQVEDAKAARAPGRELVRREITRVLTPGTAGFQLAAGESRFLAAVARAPGNRGGGAIGLAVLDVSTGEFRATEVQGGTAETRLGEELARWRPRELLYAHGAGDAPLFRGRRPEELAEATLTPLEAWMLEPEFGQGVLESHFGVLSLEGFGLAGRRWAQAAAGAIVHYVKETQRSALAHVNRLGYYERQQGLMLDAVTVRNLELLEPLMAAPAGGGGNADATLRGVLDASVTAMGKRLLRQWILRPSGEAAEIEARLDGVGRLVQEFGLRQKLRAAAAGIQDLERLLGRIGLDTALPRDLLALGASLAQVPELRGLLAQEPGRLGALGRGLDGCAALRAAIAAQLVEDPPASLADGGIIRAGVHAELDELRGLSHDAKGLIARIEARERARTTIGSLKVRFNSVFGYFIEVSKPNLRLVPADYERKQTLVNAERFTTAELKELERKILSADERSQALERELFLALRQQAAAQAAAIRQDAAAIAELDLLANFAHLAAERGYCRPQIATDGRLEIVAGRHPVVERLGAAAGERFVPNDLYLERKEARARPPEGGGGGLGGMEKPQAGSGADEGAPESARGREPQRLLILTGPNMGGKSTYLRQTALIVILAQMGSFVPAEKARLPLTDRIFTRIGASDNLARGRSTFMVEMTEAAAILNQATPRSLVLLDEIGRGTATYDGLSLAWAIAEFLHGAGPLTLFATHYHELTELARRLPGVRNARVAVAESEQGIVFLRRVEAGEASRSYGIEVARLAGLPPQVIERARAILARHEAAGGGWNRQMSLPW